jgi:phosphoglycerate dehydrogenase-like enzyme
MQKNSPLRERKQKIIQRRTALRERIQYWDATSKKGCQDAVYSSFSDIASQTSIVSRHTPLTMS